MSSDDVTRLGSDETHAADGTRGRRASNPSSSGWLTSSDAIDHGRFPPGTILGGRYRIVGRLGGGGMGEVFRADDLKLGQPVALKFLPGDVDRDPARLTQLHTEVRMARQVSHPNVCRVYDIDEVEGQTFLSMEYVDGEDLASVLRRFGRFSQERALEIARQMCAGLAAAHERGVVHRDFKPANVMLDSAGKVRIADFGLAGLAGESLRAGTPTYMAPEQLAGGEVTARSDIYAVGLVLYEIFTGQRALDARNLAELIRRREQAEIVPPSSLVRDLAPEIDDAIMRCLAPDPQARPSSALMVAAALPGGDPLAAALAAGETPSPEAVAAAGETASLAPVAGLALVAFVLAGLVAIAFASDRALLVGRIPLDLSADVLEDRARQVLVRAGVPHTATDSARGVAVNTDFLFYVARHDASRSRWDVLARGDAPALRFWYRTSPRQLLPWAPNWTPSPLDPPLTVAGMSKVVVDDRGRLLEFSTVPDYASTLPDPERPADWPALFDAAGFAMTAFAPVDPHRAPGSYADRRLAWEGPSTLFPGTRTRVEAAEFSGRPVSFQVVSPWSSPPRPATPNRAAWTRTLATGGTLLSIALTAGGILLVRYNVVSGRADRRGALRITLFLLSIWTASWLLGAKHSLDVQVEWGRFISFIAFAITNVTVTGVFYLALEPFVRRYFPDILISWTRIIAGRFNDPRVARDVLIGIALGIFLSCARMALGLPSLWLDTAPPVPISSSVQFLLGERYALSSLLRSVPNQLQSAMVGTFLFVLLRAAIGRTWIAASLSVALLAAVVLFEGGDSTLLSVTVVLVLFVAPIMAVFLRYGVVAVAAALLVNQWTIMIPLTADLSRANATLSTMTILFLGGVAAAAFRASGAWTSWTNGLSRRADTAV
jgi:tRNA A-37 threonylcarbamoyl transferase component Bud32